MVHVLFILSICWNGWVTMKATFRRDDFPVGVLFALCCVDTIFVGWYDYFVFYWLVFRNMDVSYWPSDRVSPSRHEGVEMGNSALRLALRRVDGTRPVSDLCTRWAKGRRGNHRLERQNLRNVDEM